MDFETAKQILNENKDTLHILKFSKILIEFLKFNIILYAVKWR